MLVVALAGFAAPASAGSTTLCTGYAGCAAANRGDAGYGANSGTSYWGMTPGHNCTNYAAYRLARNGADASYLRGYGNAYQWASRARQFNVAVNQTPAVGSIAWWGGSSGHVAYVEEVGAGYILVSEDNFPMAGSSGEFHWKRLTPGDRYPAEFIHFKDIAPTPPPPPNNPPTDSDGDGVPDAIDRCPRVPGKANNRGCRTDEHTVSGRFYGNDDKLDVLSFYDYGNDSLGAWVFPGTTNGVGQPAHLWRTPEGTWNWSSAVFVAGDFAGNDGKTDVIGFYDYGNDELGAWLFRGTGNGLERERLLWRTGPGHWNMLNGRTFLVGDFAGNDDQDDVLALYDYGNDEMGVWSLRGNGDGVDQQAFRWRTGPGTWNMKSSKFVAGEFTGTPGTDLVAFYDYGNDDLGTWVFPGSGDGIGQGRFSWRSGPGSWRHQSAYYVAGDFGDDELTDVVALYDYGNDELAQWSFRGNGNGVDQQAFRWRTGPGMWNPSSSKWVVTSGSELSAFYNYGNDDLGAWQLPGANGGVGMPRFLWRTGAGMWNWTSM
ncbi:CHAP domain-containing protein [Streptomyces sp. ID05-26A]|nr:CHAP domain-containing protein [Streptomyces sp. ID05-26A]